VDEAKLFESAGKLNKYLSLNTKMLTASCELLLMDSGYSAKECREDSVGMIIGSMYGNYERSTEYISKFTRHGLAGITPMDGIDAGQNPAMNYASIQIKATGIHKMISSGISSGLDAVGSAYQYIKNGRAVAVVAGGHENIFKEMIYFYAAKGLLSQASGRADAGIRPFDQMRSGILLGEGSAVLFLEEYEHAVKRKARIYAEITGYANGFAPPKGNGQYQPSDRQPDVVSYALKSARLKPESISYINACANGSRSGDRMEAALISKVFQNSRNRVPITSIKGAVGECCGASGAMQCISAVHSIADGVIPPTLNCTDPIFEGNSSIRVARIKMEKNIENVMINAFDCHGFRSCLIVSHFKK